MLLAALFFPACSAKETPALPEETAPAGQASTPAPSPVPTPETQTVPNPEADAAERDFFAVYETIPLQFSSKNAYDAIGLDPFPGFQEFLANVSAVQAIASGLSEAMQARGREAAEELSERYPDSVFRYSISMEPIGWKYAAAILWAFEGELADVAEDLFVVSCRASSGEDESLCLEVKIVPSSFQDFCWTYFAGQNDTYLHCRYLMSYLTTVYDDEGKEKAYVQPELDEAYEAAMGKPLTRTHFWDGWYQGRSGNSRKHTGLDMHGARNAPIFSCTDGVVLFKGYDEIAGYYVIVLDDEGYEYHYYHMVRESDFLTPGQRVKRGERIGNVGNTGNSAVNHLHLALVNPDDVYVRLYDVMKGKYY